ncbi:MAG: PLP-dependent transferase [Thermoanaerobaculia bacterium]|nr:PLP-dependent transferase [Thermoanaerobaculia bacterium]
MADNSSRYRLETRLIHGRMRSVHWDYRDHIIPPISSSAAYRLKSAERGAEGFLEFANPEFNREEHPPIYIYDRLDEPSRGMLEETLEIAEGGEACVTFATGMAAISGALGVLLKTGDTVVSHRTVYGCTYSLFTNWYPRFGIRVVFTDLTDLRNLERLLAEDPTIMAVYGESPVNPNLEILDLRGIAERVAATNAARPPRRLVFTVIDNTFATPFSQRPIEHGIDIVVHSLTKNIGGFGTDMGGAVIAPKLLEPDLLLYRKDFGGVLSPKAAWPPLVYGLPTLALRSRRQMEIALEVARFLEGHPKITKVVYPGLPSHPQHELARRQMLDPEGNFAPGILIYFLLEGEGEEVKRRGARLMDKLANESMTITLAVSLGQLRTLIEHPSSMTHAPVPVEKQAEAHIDPGGIRLSMGLEHPADIIADLERALEAV